MSPPPRPRPFRPAGFRTKLLLAMMLVIGAITALVLYFAGRNLAAAVERDLERAFEADLAAWNGVQNVRHAALVERCRALVRKPRIHAALEDNALDLLHPTAEDELRDVMQPGPAAAAGRRPSILRAEFYRFLDQSGAVIPPADAGGRAIGTLEPDEVARLALEVAPVAQQIGYLPRTGGQSGTLTEIIATPIVSHETGEVIAALVLGFKPGEQDATPAGAGTRRGVWLDGKMHLTDSSEPLPESLTRQIAAAIAAPAGTRKPRLEVAGIPHLLFHRRLNPASLYPPAEEVCLYPLTGLLAQRRQLQRRILAAGALLLLGGLGVSHLLAGRLSRPVEQLAADSAENLTQRQRAEAALESTSEELRRAARFSADASHQLMTPVTVLRAGLEELLARKSRPARECEEVSALIHQTYRLSSIIKDLLLLSRMDAGRLTIEFSAVNLSLVIEAALDDLSALPEGFDLGLETDFPPELLVAGEKGYITLILQNLLENARKYNRPGGRIRIVARPEASRGVVRVANTGAPIPRAAQERIFERFHRGAVGENVPGYGLGLNLARQLARLHQGDVLLVRSDASWTEFEARFLLAGALAQTGPPPA